MKKLIFLTMLLCLSVSACSGQVYAEKVFEPTRTLVYSPSPLPTATIEPTQTIQPSITVTQTATPLPTQTELPRMPKILLLGDSMLALSRVPTFLYELLQGGGYKVEFVGDDYPYGNIVPANGLGGFDTRRVLNQLTQETVWTKLNGTQFPNNFVYQVPDIVVIQLGTNDAINAYVAEKDPVPSYTKNMEMIIDYIRSKNERVTIVVPMLIPSSWPEYTAKIEQVNSAIPDFVEDMDTPSSRVVTTVRLREIWEYSDFIDNVHPNDSGARKIAKAYYDALVNNNLLVGY